LQSVDHQRPAGPGARLIRQSRLVLRRRPGLPSLAGAGSGQQALMAQYNPECQPPFLDVASKWTAVGSYPDPSVIEGMSWQQITSVLRRARANRLRTE
jgi:hypothetical protein